MHEGSEGEAVEAEVANDHAKNARVGSLLQVHDDVDYTGAEEDVSEVDGSHGEHNASDKEDDEDGGEQLNEVLVNTPGIVELDPALVVQFLGVSSVTAVGKTTNSRLFSGEALSMLFFELFHEFSVESFEASWDNDDKTEEEGHEAQQGAGKQNQRVYLGDQDDLGENHFCFNLIQY